MHFFHFFHYNRIIVIATLTLRKLTDHNQPSSTTRVAKTLEKGRRHWLSDDSGTAFCLIKLINLIN